MAILMFGEPGVEILYPDPGFPIYRSMIEFTGAKAVPVPIREENGFAFSADETLALITPKTRLLIINSPANPTGGVTPKAEIDKLIKGLARFPDVAIMSDEIYEHLVYDGARTHSIAEVEPRLKERTLTVNGEQWMDGEGGTMYHDWASFIVRASRDSRIVPGDVIGSGTVGGGSIGEAIYKHRIWVNGDGVSVDDPYTDLRAVAKRVKDARVLVGGWNTWANDGNRIATGNK